VRGDLVRAHEAFVRGQSVAPMANHALPYLSVEGLLHLAQAALGCSEVGTAQAILRHAEQILRRRPHLGSLTDKLTAVRCQVEDASTSLVGSSMFTPAELRVLQFLPTHLSFQDIGDRLTVSRNTVKTHAMSIYGKLWASSRNEAVERAVQLGLLEPNPVLRPGPGSASPSVTLSRPSSDEDPLEDL
jgi:LuxR family maltose regulon positive regulatory protein